MLKQKSVTLKNTLIFVLHPPQQNMQQRWAWWSTENCENGTYSIKISTLLRLKINEDRSLPESALTWAATRHTHKIHLTHHEGETLSSHAD